MGTERDCRVENLRCEYRCNPLGIDIPRPRFSWSYAGGTRGGTQSAYRVEVSREGGKAGSSWDSGWVLSERQTHIVYHGEPLCSAARYFWRVSVRVEENAETIRLDSAEQWFETGLLVPEDWSGGWIGAMDFTDRTPYFRHEFRLAGPIIRARAYICGLGYYELRLDGEKVGDHLLDPAWTNYDKRALYAVYDVTSRLTQGEHAVGVVLGRGYYAAACHATANRILPFLLELRIDLADGTQQRVCSRADGSWRCTTQGPLISNSVYDGDVYDARLEMDGWDRPGYRPPDGRWKAVVRLEPPCAALRAQTMEPVRIVEEKRAAAFRCLRPGVYLYDFGVNMAGVTRLTVSGKSGARVRLRFAELTGPDGAINRENIRGAKAEDVYICRSGEASWTPAFTYHGFRYVQAETEGETAPLTAESLVACVMRSAVEPIGTFACGNDLLNRIQACCVRTEASNLHGLPTDCPQRDERMGWLNDMTVRAEAALYQFGLVSLYEKWERDILEEQSPVSGAVWDTAPRSRFGRRPADPVCSSVLLVPWLTYLHTGDEAFLRDSYEGMRRWTECIWDLSRDGIVEFSSYGDWASPIGQGDAASCAGAVSAITPGALISTAFLYKNCRLMAKAASVLNKPEDVRRFRELGARVYEAFQSRFYEESAGCYGGGSQASQAIALRFGLVPERERRRVTAALARDIRARDIHLTTGNICTPYVLDALSDNGELDLAFALAVQTTYPSWGYMLEKGATTIWERWELAETGELAEMGSHNHPMYASISGWFFRSLAGIRPDEAGPGFRRFHIRPYVPEALGSACASVRTAAGPVSAAWEKTQGLWTLRVRVPFNTSAAIHLPLWGQSPRVTESGRLLFDGTWKACDGALTMEQVTAERLRLRAAAGSYVFEVEGREEQP